MSDRIPLTSEELANLLTQAYHEGWESGHAGDPEPEPEDTFLLYLEESENDPEATRH